MSKKYMNYSEIVKDFCDEQPQEFDELFQDILQKLDLAFKSAAIRNQDDIAKLIRQAKMGLIDMIEVPDEDPKSMGWVGQDGLP